MNRLNNLLHTSTSKVVQKSLSTNKSENYFNYPYIDKTVFAETMDNYRSKVLQYNNQVYKENIAIDSYNALVKQSLKLNPITEEQVKALCKLNKDHEGIFTRDYNALVEALNKSLRPFALKTKIKTIKFQIELTFSTILGFYASQLRQRNARFMENGQSTAGVLPKININSLDICTHKKNDIVRLDISKRTAQRHIKALREANILVAYHFKGSKKPIACYINSNILKVRDSENPLGKIAQKIALSVPSTTSCRNISGVTRTIKEDKKKGDVNNIHNAETPLKLRDISNKNNNYKNTEQESKKSGALSRKSANSEILKGRIQEHKKLAADLSEHKYDNYQVIPIEVLQREADKGTMTRDEFKTLIIQDFLMYSAKLWRNSTPYVGSWLKAYYNFQDNFFLSINNTQHKDTALETIKKWRWMMQTADTWFKKTKITPLFPNQYFDQSRKDGKEIGFFYLYKAYKHNQQKKQRRLEAKKQREIDAKKRKKKLTDHRKCIIAIKKYLKNKTDFKQLYQYVATTLPNEYLDNLAHMISEENNKLFH